MNNKDRLITIAHGVIYPKEEDLKVLKYSIRLATGQEGEDLFGLRVDKYDNNGIVIESNETQAFTGSIKKAISLAEDFAAGTVTPCVLDEMIDEWLLARAA